MLVLGATLIQLAGRAIYTQILYTQTSSFQRLFVKLFIKKPGTHKFRYLIYVHISGKGTFGVKGDQF